MPRRTHTPSPFSDLIDTLADTLADAAEDFMDHLMSQQPGLLGQGAGQGAGEKKAKKVRTTGPVRRGKGERSNPRVKTPRPAPQAREDTLYDVLEVAPRCSPETLSAAFRSLSIKLHPDKFKDVDMIRESRMRSITAAWSVLKDPEQRKQYDRSIGLK